MENALIEHGGKMKIFYPITIDPEPLEVSILNRIVKIKPNERLEVEAKQAHKIMDTYGVRGLVFLDDLDGVARGDVPKNEYYAKKALEGNKKYLSHVQNCWQKYLKRVAIVKQGGEDVPPEGWLREHVGDSNGLYFENPEDPRDPRNNPPYNPKPSLLDKIHAKIREIEEYLDKTNFRPKDYQQEIPAIDRILLADLPDVLSQQKTSHFPTEVPEEPSKTMIVGDEGAGKESDKAVKEAETTA